MYRENLNERGPSPAMSFVAELHSVKIAKTGLSLYHFFYYKDPFNEFVFSFLLHQNIA